MSDLPYTTDVLRLAAEANGAGRLPPPCLTHTEHNPACGDRSTVDLQVENGVVVAIAHDTRACVLSQASASILGAAMGGRPVAELVSLRNAVQSMLQGAGPGPGGTFARYRYLADVASHPGRHRCVLLPIDAALKALKGSEPG